MLDWLLDPFSGSLMQRALLEVLVVAVACGPIGVWVLLYRQSYAAESLAHAMLPGLVVASLAGVSLLLGALAVHSDIDLSVVCQRTDHER